MNGTVLVTGAGGYIGRHVVLALLERGVHVKALDLRLDGVDPRAERVAADLFSADPEIYDRLGRPDVVLHMAWRDGFKHNSPAHLDDLPAHFHLIENLLAGGLKHLAVMGTMHEVGYWEGPIDETSIPTGEILKVAGTPFDFRTPKPVGQDINADDEQIRIGAGYDHCFVLNKKEEGELSFAARIREPESGRTMEVYTTEPGVQVYTDNWADGYKGQHGATFPRRSAICFEAQHFPDSPNHPYFPSVVLEPGREYTQKTVYKFGVEKQTTHVETNK